MHIIYRLLVMLYHAGIWLSGFFSSKARRWLDGRKGWEGRMQQMAEGLAGKKPKCKTIWFHCASLGEFEQGRPVLEQFRKNNPGWTLLLSFFSPSGFEVRKNYAHADAVVYMPLDTPANVNRFLDIWNPDIAVFVKYEYWYGYIRELAQRDVHTIVVSAIFRRKQLFFRFYGGWFRKHLALISWFFVQDEYSSELMQKYGITQVTVSGDTRFDRVYELAESIEPLPVIQEFTSGHKVMVAGSTWPKDEKLLLRVLKACRQQFKMIIAPHEVSGESIRKLKSLAGEHAVLLSGLEANGNPDTKARVLIIDRMGLLSKLYRFGDLAYVGGGFGQGIHNILEAATYGIPVVFGPRHEKFAEAVDLLKLGGAFCVSNEKELRNITGKLLSRSGKRICAGQACRKYIEEKRGATEVIIKHLETATT